MFERRAVLIEDRADLRQDDALPRQLEKVALSFGGSSRTDLGERTTWNSAGPLEDLMKRFRGQILIEKAGIVGIEGIDTRALVRRIRIHGALRGVLSTQDTDDASLVAKAKASPGLVDELGLMTRPFLPVCALPMLKALELQGCAPSTVDAIAPRHLPRLRQGRIRRATSAQVLLFGQDLLDLSEGNEQAIFCPTSQYWVEGVELEVGFI